MDWDERLTMARPSKTRIRRDRQVSSSKQPLVESHKQDRAAARRKRRAQLRKIEEMHDETPPFNEFVITENTANAAVKSENKIQSFLSMFKSFLYGAFGKAILSR